MKPVGGARQRLRHIPRDRARDAMRLGRFLHARGDVDRAAIDADRPLGVALFADDHVAAMDPDAKARDDTELRHIAALLAPNGGEHRIDGAQYLVVMHRLAPIPDRDQPVALVKIDRTAVIGDRLGNIEQELADQAI